MVTVHREAGFRFIIFVDDHEPAHVHVIGDGKAKIDLGGAMAGRSWSIMTAFKAGDLRRRFES